MQPKISKQEFKERVLKIQKEMQKEGYDLLLAYANEAEPQYVRYLSDYWPSFELAAVLVPVVGKPYLLIGPESMTFAKSVSKISDIRRILKLRESSEPDYPGQDLDTFESVIKEMTELDNINKVGIAGYSLISKIVYDEFAEALEEFDVTEISKADHIINNVRKIKTESELECLRYSYSIADYAMEQVIDNIKVGMTENELKGIAMKAIYEKGAEGEGYNFWILAGKGSNQAVSRLRNKTIEDGDIVQVQVSARYEGYVSTIGRPIIMGEPTQYQLDLVNAGYEVEREIFDIAKPGLPAKKISEKHKEVLTDLGFEDHILYGPVHGTGLMENEEPWVEENSEYELKEGMTFCTCLYLGNDDKEVGIRVENGFLITDSGVEVLSKYPRKLINIR